LVPGRGSGFTEIAARASTPAAAPPARDSPRISSALPDAEIKKFVLFAPGGFSRLPSATGIQPLSCGCV